MCDLSLVPVYQSQTFDDSHLLTLIQLLDCLGLPVAIISQAASIHPKLEFDLNSQGAMRECPFAPDPPSNF